MNKEITEWLRLDDSGGHLVQFLLKQEHPEQVVQNHVQATSEDSKQGDSVLSPAQHRSASGGWKEPPVFQFIPIASCPGTGHH